MDPFFVHDIVFFVFSFKMRWSPVILQPVKHAQHSALKAQVALALQFSFDKRLFNYQILV
jgi:hypothetical protein